MATNLGERKINRSRKETLNSNLLNFKKKKNWPSAMSCSWGGGRQIHLLEIDLFVYSTFLMAKLENRSMSNNGKLISNKCFNSKNYYKKGKRWKSRISILVGWLVGCWVMLYGISTLVGYLLLHLVCPYIIILYMIWK